MTGVCPLSYIELIIGFYSLFLIIEYFSLNSREKMEIAKLNLVRNALNDALDYLTNDMEAMCDEDYYSEAQSVVESIEQALKILDEES